MCAISGSIKHPWPERVHKYYDDHADNFSTRRYLNFFLSPYVGKILLSPSQICAGKTIKSTAMATGFSPRCIVIAISILTLIASVTAQASSFPCTANTNTSVEINSYYVSTINDPKPDRVTLTLNVGTAPISRGGFFATLRDPIEEIDMLLERNTIDRVTPVKDGLNLEYVTNQQVHFNLTAGTMTVGQLLDTCELLLRSCEAAPLALAFTITGPGSSGNGTVSLGNGNSPTTTASFHRMPTGFVGP